MYILEPNKPIPARAATQRYPYANMLIGESFVVPREVAQRARLAASAFKARNPGWDYQSHSDPEGVRVWRVA